MGLIGNAVKQTASGIAKSAVTPSGAASGFARNASTSLSLAAKQCPVLSEFGNVAQGIAQGDFKKAAVNTGILAMAASVGGSASKGVHSSTSATMKMAAVSTGQALRGGGNPQKAVLKPLPFALNGLEPVISEHLMGFHYNKHHATYVKNYNALQEKATAAMEAGDHQTHVDLSQAIKFNGGGHMNHEFFWDSLSPIGEKGGKRPDYGSDLHAAIEHSFGSLDKFIAHFSSNTSAVQGSGWGWLAYNKQSTELEFRTTANQDRLIEQGAHLVPLLTIDIWEHAYYLDYQNVRPNFMKEIWKIVNWEKVSERYDAATKGAKL